MGIKRIDPTEKESRLHFLMPANGLSGYFLKLGVEVFVESYNFVIYVKR